MGLVVAGTGGLWSGLVGAVLSLLFLGITAVGILASGRLARGDSLVAMAVLMGGWFLKLVLFVIVMILIAKQPWVVPGRAPREHRGHGHGDAPGRLRRRGAVEDPGLEPRLSAQERTRPTPARPPGSSHMTGA